MKKIIIAPDSFKGTLSSLEVCEVIEKICRKYFPDIEIVALHPTNTLHPAHRSSLRL